MKLANLLENYELPYTLENMLVAGLCLDSRKIENGELFIALKGAQSDGKTFIADARARGACAALIESNDQAVSLEDGFPCIYYPQLKSKLSALAGKFFAEPSRYMDVLGVTGTNGKSTCVSLLAQVANQLDVAAWQLGTVGYGKPGKALIDTGLTTPDAISCQRILSQAQKTGQSMVAMEVSSHAVAQHRVAGVNFRGGMFTNISRDHLDYHASFEEYADVKLSFLRDYAMDFVALNYDDEFGKQTIDSEVLCGREVFSWSLVHSDASVWVSSSIFDLHGVRAMIHSPWGEGELKTELIGEFNLSNALATLTMLGALEYDFKDILEALARVQGVDGRMQKVPCDDENMPAVFVDYAHTPDALQKALTSLQLIGAHNLWVIFGCGGDRDRGKRALMAEVACAHAQKVIVTSDNPRSEDPQAIIADIQKGLVSSKSEVIEDREDAIKQCIERLPADACLLIAGKGHEKYQLVGEARLPFDDYLIAEQALQARSSRSVQ